MDLSASKYLQLMEEVVRETLSLAQGHDGKYIAFHPNIPFQCLVSARGIQLDPNVLLFLKRMANVGHFFRLVSAGSEQFKKNVHCPMQRSIGKAIDTVLDAHIKMITDLYIIRVTGPDRIKVQALLEQTVSKFDYLRVVLGKVNKMVGIELLNQLYLLTAHGDGEVQQMMQNLFAITLETFFTLISEWILRDSDQSGLVSLLFLKKDETNFTFLTLKTQRFISRLEAILRTFQPVFDKIYYNWIKPRIRSIFTNIPFEYDHQFMIKLNFVLENRLQVVYKELNTFLLNELKRKQSVQTITSQIELFFFTSDDRIRTIEKRLGANQLNLLVTMLEKKEHRPTWQKINQQLIKLDQITNYTSSFSCDQSFLFPIYFQNDLISLALVNGDCRLEYLKIFIILYGFKLSKKAILDCCKQISNFSSRFKIDQDISFDIKRIIYKISFKLYQCVWIMWKEEDKMFSAVKLQFYRFCEQIQSQDQVLKWSILHQRFLGKIKKEIKTTIKEQLHSITELAPTFCRQVNLFIDLTEQTFGSNDQIWWDQTEKNVKLYRKQLDKLGIVNFIDSICFQ